MSLAQKKAVMAHRRRMKRQGIVRLEVRVGKDDASLVRDVAAALVDPRRAAATRALLREGLGAPRTVGLKALLAAAPLDGVTIERDRDLGRPVEL